MRIAVAGTGELAQKIAQCIDRETSHSGILLTRSHRPQLNEICQIAVVDYSNIATIQYALRGIDTVISTVTGPNQILLIRAAVSARVRRFAPAEFEGLPALRPQDDPLDRGRAAARAWLQYFSQHIQSTTFVCGIFYERFQPGGLRQSRMGLTSGLCEEGDYILNCRAMFAQVPCYDQDNKPNVAICAAAIEDVARFVTRALELAHWPAEMRMFGQRMLVVDLVMLVQQLKGRSFDPIQWHNPHSLRSELQLAALNQDHARVTQLHALLVTAEGRYDFTDFNMNALFPDLQTVSFRDWFIGKWDLQRT